jgi:hypothetical protein
MGCLGHSVDGAVTADGNHRTALAECCRGGLPRDI